MNVEKIIDIVCQGKNDEKVEDFFLLTDERDQPVGDQALWDELRAAIVAAVDGEH